MNTDQGIRISGQAATFVPNKEANLAEAWQPNKTLEAGLDQIVKSSRTFLSFFRGPHALVRQAYTTATLQHSILLNRNYTSAEADRVKPQDAKASLAKIAEAVKQARNTGDAIKAIQNFSPGTDQVEMDNALAFYTPEEIIAHLGSKDGGAKSRLIAQAAYTALVDKRTKAMHAEALTKSKPEYDAAIEHLAEMTRNPHLDPKKSADEYKLIREKLKADPRLSGDQRNAVLADLEKKVKLVSPEVSAARREQLLKLLPPEKPQANLPPLAKLKFLRAQDAALTKLSLKLEKEVLFEADKILVRAQITSLRAAYPAQVKEALLAAFADSDILPLLQKASEKGFKSGQTDLTPSLLRLGESMLRFTEETLGLFMKQLSLYILEVESLPLIADMVNGDPQVLSMALPGAAWDEVRLSLMSEFAPWMDPDGRQMDPEERQLQINTKFTLGVVARDLNSLYSKSGDKNPTTVFTSGATPEQIVDVLKAGVAYKNAKIKPEDINLQLANWAILTHKAKGTLDANAVQELLTRIGVELTLDSVQARINEGFSNTAQIIDVMREVQLFSRKIPGCAKAIAAVKEMGAQDGIRRQALVQEFANKLSGSKADPSQSPADRQQSTNSKISDNIANIVSNKEDLTAKVKSKEASLQTMKAGYSRLEDSKKAMETTLKYTEVMWGNKKLPPLSIEEANLANKAFADSSGKWPKLPEGVLGLIKGKGNEDRDNLKANVKLQLEIEVVKGNLALLLPDIKRVEAELKSLKAAESERIADEVFTLKRNGPAALDEQEKNKLIALEARLNEDQARKVKEKLSGHYLNQIIDLKSGKSSRFSGDNETYIKALKALLTPADQRRLFLAVHVPLMSAREVIQTGTEISKTVAKKKPEAEALDMMIFLAAEKVREEMDISAEIFTVTDHREEILYCLKEEFGLDAARIINSGSDRRRQFSEALSSNLSLSALTGIYTGKIKNFEDHARVYLAQTLEQSTAELNENQSFKFTFGTRGVVNLTPALTAVAGGLVSPVAQANLETNNSVEVCCNEKDKSYDVLLMHARAGEASAGASFFTVLEAKLGAKAAMAAGFQLRFDSKEKCTEFLKNLAGADPAQALETWGHTNVQIVANKAFGASLSASVSLPDPVKLFTAQGLDLGFGLGIAKETTFEKEWETRHNAEVQIHSQKRTLDVTLQPNTQAASSSEHERTEKIAAKVLDQLGLELDYSDGYQKSRTITMATSHGALTNGSGVTEEATVKGKQNKSAVWIIMPKLSISHPDFMPKMKALIAKADKGSVFSVKYEFTPEAIELYNHTIAFHPEQKDEATKKLQLSLRPVSISLRATESEEATTATSLTGKSTVGKGVAIAAQYAPMANVKANASASSQSEIDVINFDDYRDGL